MLSGKRSSGKRVNPETFNPVPKDCWRTSPHRFNCSCHGNRPPFSFRATSQACGVILIAGTLPMLLILKETVVLAPFRSNVRGLFSMPTSARIQALWLAFKVLSDTSAAFCAALAELVGSLRGFARCLIGTNQKPDLNDGDKRQNTSEKHEPKVIASNSLLGIFFGDERRYRRRGLAAFFRGVFRATFLICLLIMALP